MDKLLFNMQFIEIVGSSNLGGEDTWGGEGKEAIDHWITMFDAFNLSHNVHGIKWIWQVLLCN